MDIQQIVLRSRPQGEPTAGTFAFEKSVLPPLQPGELHLKGQYYSVDPYMRGRMNDVKSYAPPFQIGQPIVGGVVAEVVESAATGFQKGDLVTGRMPWATEMIVTAKTVKKIDAALAPASYYLGLLGMPGLTAYFGLMAIGRPKPGETVVISGAAGAVGLVVGQIAKIQGCRAVGIAGSDEKTAMLTDRFGFDAAINYKTEKNLSQAVGAACPLGVDIYFDNVGGEISDAVIAHLNFHARIPLCGQISLYNSKEIPTGPRIQTMLLTRSVLMQGFIVGDFQDRFPEAFAQLGTWLREGKLTYEQTIIDGFENLPRALMGLFSGQNKGKMVVRA